MRRLFNHALPLVWCSGLVLTVASCSGGDKIVDPNAVASTGGGNNTSYKWNSGDSTYFANLLIGGASSAISGMRTIRTPDLPLYGKNAPPCAPTSTTGGADSNNNGVPDNQTVQYVASSCKDPGTGVAYTVAGSVQIQDLGEIFAYRATYTNLVLTATKGDSVTTSTLSGTLELHWTSTNAASYIDKSTVVISTRSSLGSISLSRAANLTSQFTPISGSTISATQALPGGTMTFSGTLGITGTTSGDKTPANQPPSLPYTIAVSSPVTLSLTATCLLQPVFSAGGTISGQVSGIASGTVSVRFVGCGGVGSKA
jgi:hypothetical protein